MVCGWVLWEGRARARATPCQALIRAAVERVHFCAGLARLLHQLEASTLLPHWMGWGQGCVYCFILHTRTQQALTNSKKGGSRQSLERALEPTLPGLTPIISLVATGQRLLKQLNFDASFDRACNTANWLVSEEGKKRCIYSTWAAHR